jgi:SAM-dependent methyltransferase
VHLNSQLLFERYAQSYFAPGQEVLEIGPDAVPSTYQRIVGDQVGRWTSADLHYETPSGSGRPFSTDGIAVDQVMDDESRLPFGDASFDVVISGQVLEHVRRIWLWFQEVARVCKPGGYVITICPVSWPYHEAPIDCWRIFPEGMRALCDDSGLEVITSTFESLEPKVSSRTYPGQSHFYNRPSTTKADLKDRVRRLIAWPTPTAIDTFTVARKPAP